MTHLFAFLKLFGDTALWLACAGGLLSLFGTVSNLILVSVAVGLGCLCAHILRDRKPRLTWLGMVPALASLLLCRSTVDVLAVLPPIVYLGMSIHQDSLDPDSGDLSYRFGTWATVAVLGCILCVVRGMNWGFLCAILCLCSGVFLMRMVRHDVSDFSNRGLMTLEVGLLAVVCLLCILLSQPAVINASAAVLKAFYSACIVPLLMLLIRVFMGLMWVVEWLLNLIIPGEVSLIRPEQNAGGNGNQSPMFEEVETVDVPVLLAILKILGVVIFLAVAYALFRYLMNKNGRKKEEAGEADARMDLPAQRDPDPSPGLLNRSPVAKIRRSYAAFCKTVDRTAGSLHPSDTTRSVNQRASLQDDPKAQQLRGLYLRARYTAHGDLKNTDAHQAASLSRQLRDELEHSAGNR